MTKYRHIKVKSNLKMKNTLGSSNNCTVFLLLDYEWHGWDDNNYSNNKLTICS